jgi:hypothetical protein
MYTKYSEYSSVAVSCDSGNELSGSVKSEEFTDQLRASQLLRKNSAAQSVSNV